jgi:hypothetical protein
MSTQGESYGRRLRRWQNLGASMLVLIAASLLGAPAAFPQGDGSLRQVEPDELCVTNGTVALRDSALAVETPSSRAVVRTAGRAGDQAAEIRFRYLGPSSTDKPLASGELRRQIGLKLQAEDSCNVVYAMWHIAPDTRVAVSVKRNTALHAHTQCGAGGYVFLKSRKRIDPPPTIQPGEAHVLRAELHRGELTVTTDGEVAWQGSLGAALPSGPMGFRTDNVRATLDFFINGAPGKHAEHQAGTSLGRCSQPEAD